MAELRKNSMKVRWSSLMLKNKRQSLRRKPLVFEHFLFSVLHDFPEIAISFIVVQSITHNKEIRHGEADMVNVEIQQSLCRIVQKGTDPKAFRLEGLQMLQDIADGQTRTDHILQKEDVSACDVQIKILDIGDHSMLFLILFDTDGQKIQLDGHGEMSCKIREEIDGSFEDADDDELLILIIGIDILCRFLNSFSDFVLREDCFTKIIHLQDPPIVQIAPPDCENRSCIRC